MQAMLNFMRFVNLTVQAYLSFRSQNPANLYQTCLQQNLHHNLNGQRIRAGHDYLFIFGQTLISFILFRGERCVGRLRLLGGAAEVSFGSGDDLPFFFS